ncbi:hypothetical protein HOLleu_07512 [Holothuria leucospilota]|uniref:CCHC-type domain-containing protein n=1 Tax=Holothuria leucospilota TaxID=206669 RepID=A0A9Q1CHQ2_HOLLE|nr:hypothetical protein HOLleu_07512 [Holothuria leucospilota]
MDLDPYLKQGKELSKELLEFARYERNLVQEKKKIARDERQLEREHQREIKECELEIARQSNLRNPGEELDFTTSRPAGRVAKLPKLPHFNDGTDRMDAYFCRFERFATVAGWPETDWATSLSTLLTGKALEVYSRMPIANSADYKSLTCAPLHKYQLTAEGFRNKFRTAKLESGETYIQLRARIKGYLIRWVELGGKDKTYDDLVDRLLQEQIIRSGGKEMTMFLKERKPDDSKAMAKLADKYQEAHLSYDKGKGKSDHEKRIGGKSDRDLNSNRSVGSSSGDGAKRKSCYVCGKSGHLARDCWVPSCSGDNNPKSSQGYGKDGDGGGMTCTIGCMYT